ncbi:MAG TPA: hypothetical protein PK677_11330 [Acidiphilium sp.]|nr:hypothetical protein [Acidiphilium sp.]
MPDELKVGDRVRYKPGDSYKAPGTVVARYAPGRVVVEYDAQGLRPKSQRIDFDFELTRIEHTEGGE